MEELFDYFHNLPELRRNLKSAYLDKEATGKIIEQALERGSLAEITSVPRSEGFVLNPFGILDGKTLLIHSLINAAYPKPKFKLSNIREEAHLLTSIDKVNRFDMAKAYA